MMSAASISELRSGVRLEVRLASLELDRRVRENDGANLLPRVAGWWWSSQSHHARAPRAYPV
jgi:hypothetical protein